MQKWFSLSIFLLLAGCGATTETGYTPRKLGDSVTIQRGYYAAPYSPEARNAQQAGGPGPSAAERRPDIR